MGIGDQNIKTIQETVKTQIVVRGSAMHLDGDKEDVKFIEMIVKEMMFTINNKGFVLPEDIRGYLASLKNGESSTMNGNGEEPVVLYTHKGSVNARTNGQKKYLEAVKENDIVFAIGPAGTGKTYQAVAMAVSALKNKAVDRIIITRPAVEAGENDMIPRDKLKTYLDQRTIEIAPLAYMRGRTLHNSFIILDEAQNATPMQMKMFLTRLGVTSKAIITGDITQIDLPKHDKSGLIDATKILKKVDGISFVYFDETDVVRHTLVKNIIKAYAKNDTKTKKVKKD